MEAYKIYLSNYILDFEKSLSLVNTFVESESIYDRIINSITMQCDKTYTDDVKLKVLGCREDDMARIIVNELQLPITIDDFLIQYRNLVKEKLQYPEFMPGARELIKHLHNNQIPIAVATSSSQSAMELKTKYHGDEFKLFSHIVCGSSDPEVKNGKPAPDIFLVCASRFPDKPLAANCLVFEDAPNGVRGAVSAGMQSVMVPAAYVVEELRKPATVVLKSLKDFKPEIFGLPTFG